MTIYIEEFLIQNIIINFCLLKLIHSTTKPTTSFFRMLIASVLGAGFSVLSAIYISNSHAMNILKILCAITMVTLAFKQTIKNRISSLLLLLIYTYALCGVVTTICGTSYATTFGMVISCKINMNYVCLIITFASYIFDIIARHLSFKFKQTNYIFDLTLQHETNKLKIKAFLDTGNMLNVNGKPVIIIDLESYLKLTNTNLINFYLNKNECLSTTTVTGNNSLKLFTIDKAILKQNNKQIELNNQYIAVNTQKFNENYQALISPYLF